jgi:DNA-binding MarR family transcriptional regulator
MTDETCRYPPTLADAPASAKLLFRELADADGPLTPSELADRTDLAPSTVRSRLRAMRQRGAVKVEVDRSDLRRRPFHPTDRLR